MHSRRFSKHIGEMPRSKRQAHRYSGSKIFNVNHSLDSMKEFYRTSYYDDFNKSQAKKASWSAGSVKYDVIPPIGNTKSRNGNGSLARSKRSSKSESSLSDLSLGRSLPDSCKLLA